MTPAIEEIRVPRWLRERTVESSRSDDGSLQIECRPRVREARASMLSVMFGTDFFRETPYEQWWDRPLIMVAYYWIGLLVGGAALLALWGTIYAVLSLPLGAVASPEAVSLTGLAVAMLVTGVVAVHRYVLQRRHPAVHQVQRVDVGREGIEYRLSGCSGPFRGLLDVRGAEDGTIAVEAVEAIEVDELLPPGVGGRYRTPAVVVRTADGGRLELGHGADRHDLNAVVRDIRTTLQIDGTGTTGG